jgi:flagellar hook-basal body complex protein FliE
MSGIDKLPPLPSVIPTPQKPSVNPNAKTESFGDTLRKFISDTNDMQVMAEDESNKFATGEIKDLHEVMAASEEASISMMLLLELRNKALDAYRELMRTPV